MPRLGATIGGVERDGPVHDVHPDNGVVRGAVGPDRRRHPTKGCSRNCLCSSVSFAVNPLLLVGSNPRTPFADPASVRYAAAIVLAGVIGVGFVLHERKSALERNLGQAATQLAERPVKVHCQGLAGELVDVSPEAGTR